MRAQAEALKKLIDNVGIDEVVLMPHSMGGPVAVELAEIMSKRLRGIVYAEGNVDFGDCFFSNWIITKYTYDQWVNEAFPKLLEKYKNDPAQVKYAVSFGKAGAVSTYRSSVDLVAVSKKDDIVERLVALRVPILAVFGEKNRGRFASEKKLGEVFPLVFIPDAAHSMMTDNPDSFYYEVAKFVANI
ncbi:alpha/beta hydrolase [Candidatus Bathyarchaeota archaeon]|nr:MAG: alpha/beta hydrolase [Candidatus Bathyarchaeota archaeon]